MILKICSELPCVRRINSEGDNLGKFIRKLIL